MPCMHCACRCLCCVHSVRVPVPPVFGISFRRLSPRSLGLAPIKSPSPPPKGGSSAAGAAGGWSGTEHPSPEGTQPAP